MCLCLKYLGISFPLHPQVYGTTKRRMLRIYDNSLPWCVCNFLKHFYYKEKWIENTLEIEEIFLFQNTSLNIHPSILIFINYKDMQGKAEYTQCGQKVTVLS